MKEKEILPLGSVVHLKEGTAKIMVIGRGVIFEQDGHDVYTDYCGVLVPTGFDADNGIFFNTDDVDKVVFKGYSDEDEERFQTVYREWEESVDIPKAKI